MPLVRQKECMGVAAIRRFAQKHALVFSLVVVLATLLLWSIDVDGTPLSGWDMLISHMVVAGVGVWLIHGLGLWPRAGFVAAGFWKGMLFGLPLLALGIAAALFSNGGLPDGNTFFGVPVLLLFSANMLFVGVGEEVIYRGLLLNNMLEKWGGNKRGVQKAVLVSAAVFGLAHLANLVVLPPLTVLIQAVNAAAAGVLFSAVYIRGKNIWAVIVLHALVDWLALAPQVCFAGTSVITTEFSFWQAALVLGVGTLVPLALAWVYIGRRNIRFLQRDNVQTAE